jgi:4-amino-4-deoxy-L-arabinose transferase-like glycosyltransferase
VSVGSAAARRRAWLLVVGLGGLVGAATLVLRHPPPLTASSEAEVRRFLRGFTWDEAPGSLDDAEIVLHGAAGVAGDLALTVQKTAWTRGSRDRVFVRRGQEPEIQGRFQPKESRLLFELPPGPAVGAWRDAAPMRLRSEAHTAVSGYGAVGIRIEALAFEPKGPRGLGESLLSAFHLAWLVGVVALLAGVTRDRLPAPIARLSAALPVTLGVALLVWAARDPYGLAWWLPPLPAVLGLTSVALAARAYRRSPLRRPGAAGAGFVLVAVAVALGWAGALLPLAVAAAVLGVVLLWAALPEAAAPEPTRAVAAAFLIAIVLLGAGLRFARIRHLPAGLWRDEARHGLVSARILEDPSYRPVYVAQRTPTKINMPAFGLYLLAVGVEAFGSTPWAMRPVTALAGVLTVLAVYALARRLLASRTAALLASAFLAANLCHLALSRHQFPSVFDPLLTTTGLWLAVLAFDQRTTVRRLGLVALAGVFVGLAVQTYHSARVAPFVAALLLAVLLRPEPARARALPAASFALGFLLAVLPLLVWAAGHPGAFNDRVGEVALLPAAALRAEPPLAALDRSLFAHLALFNLAGDLNGLHNLPGRPLFDAFSGFGFLCGLAVLLREWRGSAAAFLLGALALGLMPSLLSVDGPHAMRAVGAIAPACMVAALGWTWAGGLLFQRRGAAFAAAAAALVAVAAALTARAYFVEMPAHPQVLARMSLASTEMGRLVQEVKKDPATRASAVYAPAAMGDDDAFQYLTRGIPVRSFRGATLSAPAAPGDVFLLEGPAPGKGFDALESLVEAPAWRRGPTYLADEGPSFLAYRAR